MAYSRPRETWLPERAPLRIAAVLVACLLRSGAAAADEVPDDESPAVIPPVPTPSPVVLAGKPTKPDRVGRPLEWRWDRFTTIDLIVTGAGAVTTLAMSIVKPRGAHVSGGILFDDAVRDALRPNSLQTRYMFRDASDVGLSLMVTWPFFADSLMSAWWYRGSRDVAEQMALVNLQTLAITGAVQGMTNVLVSRERPYGKDCGSAGLPSDAIDCEGSTHYRSFFSGHSAFSFAGAAVVCMDHIKHELLGEPWDTLSCAGGYAVAATTATFRVVGDVHYATDVISGALVGTLIGYGVPMLHYAHVNLGTVQSGSLHMQVVPSGLGAGVVGTF
ncbi:MAG TPA: phosphatase PAP2 family protein [Polyangiaceae bacterium]|nr:phosphatase PAP2 family protein [Polyangiaceae bacterium]